MDHGIRSTLSAVNTNLMYYSGEILWNKTVLLGLCKEQTENTKKAPVLSLRLIHQHKMQASTRAFDGCVCVCVEGGAGVMHLKLTAR